MRIVIQRVTEARVCIGGAVHSEIGHGLAVLVGVENGDTADDAKWLAAKTVALRIFDDEAGVYTRGRSRRGNTALRTLLRRVFASARAQGPAGRVRRRHAGSARERRPRDHHHRLAPEGVNSRGRMMLGTAMAEAKRGAISSVRKPAMPQPIFVT